MKIHALPKKLSNFEFWGQKKIFLTSFTNFDCKSFWNLQIYEKKIFSDHKIQSYSGFSVMHGFSWDQNIF